MIGEAGERLLHAYVQLLPPEPAVALAEVRRQRLPAAVVAEFADGPARSPAWRSAVEADAERAERVRRAAALAEQCLAGLDGVAVAGDSLGDHWSSDVDVFVTPARHAAAAQALLDGGAIALDNLMSRLGAGRRRPGPPNHFAAVDASGVLAQIELSTALWAFGDSAAPAIDRAMTGAGLPRLRPQDAARRRVEKLAAIRRPDLRGVIELTELVEGGALPVAPATAAALRRHVPLEAELVGDGPLAAAAVLPSSRRSPAWMRARLRGLRRESRRRLRPHQLRVAFCGVDGAGKSTQVRLLVRNLERSGVAAQASWTRLGNGASAPVKALASVAQRVLPRGSHSFQALRTEAGRRESNGGAAAVAPPRTRRGVLGWSWAMAVTLDYIARTRAARRRARGAVLVLDRALPDALVELHDDYGIVLELGVQRRLLIRLTPAAHAVFYLQLPGEVAKARKDDTFTAAELALHTRAYERELERLPGGVVVLDAQRPPEDLALEALRRLAAC